MPAQLTFCAICADPSKVAQIGQMRVEQTVRTVRADHPLTPHRKQMPAEKTSCAICGEPLQIAQAEQMRVKQTSRGTCADSSHIAQMGRTPWKSDVLGHVSRPPADNPDSADRAGAHEADPLRHLRRQPDASAASAEREDASEADLLRPLRSSQQIARIAQIAELPAKQTFWSIRADSLQVARMGVMGAKQTSCDMFAERPQIPRRVRESAHGKSRAPTKAAPRIDPTLRRSTRNVNDSAPGVISRRC